MREFVLTRHRLAVADDWESGVERCEATAPFALGASTGQEAMVKSLLIRKAVKGLLACALAAGVLRWVVEQSEPHDS